MQEIDRVAAILRPTELMLDWINEHNDLEESFTLEEVNIDCTVILLPSFSNEEEAEDFLLDVYEGLFESELYAWNDDPKLWPQNRSIEMFFEWFDIEFHSLVYDAHEDQDEEDFDLIDESRMLQ